MKKNISLQYVLIRNNLLYLNPARFEHTQSFPAWVHEARTNDEALPFVRVRDE